MWPLVKQRGVRLEVRFEGGSKAEMRRWLGNGLLADSFNPATIEGLMRRSTLSVGWCGEIYACDFNQMLGMQMRNSKLLFLWDVTPTNLETWQIQTGPHCRLHSRLRQQLHGSIAGKLIAAKRTALLWTVAASCSLFTNLRAPEFGFVESAALTR